jgi:hypothetical protein
VDPVQLVRSVLLIEIIAFAGALAVFFGHAVVSNARERRWAVATARGRRALMEVVRTGRPTKADEALLRGLPTRLKVRLFTELIPSISGQGRAQLGALAREIGLVPVAERLARSRSWRDRLLGVRLLATIGGGLDIVPALLDDGHSGVRAEAVEWAGEHPTPEIVERLVGLLPATDCYGRFVVRDTLLRLRAATIGPLVRYLETHDGAAAEPALDVAAGIAHPAFSAVALRLCHDPDAPVRARAAALAGAIGSEEAMGVLQRMVHDDDAGVRAAAAAALGRLGHWPSAAVIAPLLRDRAWIVRSQGALALRGLGSPGHLYLRRGLTDEDPFAADISRQVLDLPESSAERERW